MADLRTGGSGNLGSDAMLIAPESPAAETLRVPVLKVFDGDGFLTSIHHPRRGISLEVTIRFGFIDAPEIEQPGGPEARDFLDAIIGGKSVDLAILTKMDTGGIVDRHGRIVAIPFLPSTCENERDWAQRLPRNVELEMVLNGWAWVLDRYGPDERYLEALEDAKRHRRGIWASDSNIHPWEFKKERYRRRQQARQSSSQPSLFTNPEAVRCCPAGCGGELLQRSGRFGPFLGCSNFPACRYSRSA